MPDGQAGPSSPSWIAKLLELERDGDVFLAREPAGSNQSGRLFGGLVAAQSLTAAAATIEGAAKLPQSLHAYFVRGGKPDVDVELVVERTRDGRSFDTRRVTAIQSGDVILEMLASFHIVEPGADVHPPPPPMPPVEACVELEVGGGSGPARFEMRAPTKQSMFTGPPHWVRMTDPIEDDPMVQACALTYVSDMGLMAAARPPDTKLTFGPGTVAASLDHSIWFHRPYLPDRWHCYHASHLNSVGARGLAIGGLYDQAGALVATMSQEALWRNVGATSDKERPA